MTQTTITKLDVNWWENYGNSPELLIYVDKRPNINDFIYTPLNGDGTVNEKPEEGNVTLLSTNMYPWIRFVYIGPEPQGNPTYHGNAGGTFKMTDGTTFKSRSGWSSRAGVINKLYKDRLPFGSEIIEPVVYDTQYKSGWHGYAICVDHLEVLYNEDEIWPTYKSARVELVRNIKFDGEPYWTPSIDKYKVVKPS